MALPDLAVQLVGVAGTAAYLISYQFRDNRKLFTAQFFAYLLYTAHLLLLGAVTGGVSYLLNLLRSLCLASKNRFLRSRTMCLILCGAQLLVLALTWAGPLSLLPVLANIASTLGGYTHNPRTIRLTGILVNSPLWILYDVLVGSWAGILDEVVSISSMLLSILRFGWSALDKAED